jgi:hypothetical protein
MTNTKPDPCPNAEHMGEHACRDRAQCWEPCGELGHSEEHAVRHGQYKPQAGEWVLMAPDGRTWRAESGLACAAKEIKECVPSAVLLARIMKEATK